MQSMIANRGELKLPLNDVNVKCDVERIADQIVLNRILSDMIRDLQDQETYKIDEVHRLLKPLVKSKRMRNYIMSRDPT